MSVPPRAGLACRRGVPGLEEGPQRPQALTHPPPKGPASRREQLPGSHEWLSHTPDVLSGSRPVPAAGGVCRGGGRASTEPGARHLRAAGSEPGQPAAGWQSPGRLGLPAWPPVTAAELWSPGRPCRPRRVWRVRGARRAWSPQARSGRPRRGGRSPAVHAAGAPQRGRPCAAAAPAAHTRLVVSPRRDPCPATAVLLARPRPALVWRAPCGQRSSALPGCRVRPRAVPGHLASIHCLSWLLLGPRGVLGPPQTVGQTGPSPGLRGVWA